MRDIGHFIGGKEVPGTSGRTADVYQPMTGEVIAKVALASRAELRAAVKNATEAQPAWAATNPQRRARVMLKFLDLVAKEMDPLAVVAGISPFNFPAMIPMWKFAPAIACGNAFILKPSERDPGVPMRLDELMIEAGLPAGLLNVVNGDKEAVDAILDEPDIK